MLRRNSFHYSDYFSKPKFNLGFCTGFNKHWQEEAEHGGFWTVITSWFLRQCAALWDQVFDLVF